MIRLSETLARRRLFYPRLLPTLPDILVIDVPAPFAHPSLPLGRYYGIMVETQEERDELDRFLCADRDAPIPPDLLDRRASALSTARITIVQYDPPVAGWPWVLLCHWPADYAAIVPATADMFARGAYTTEMFDDEGTLACAADRLVATLARSSEVNVTMIAPETLRAVGSA